nr:MAG TPA: hypothetical protein [Caudoviricetes sp.]
MINSIKLNKSKRTAANASTKTRGYTVLLYFDNTTK